VELKCNEGVCVKKKENGDVETRGDKVQNLAHTHYKLLEHLS